MWGCGLPEMASHAPTRCEALGYSPSTVVLSLETSRISFQSHKEREVRGGRSSYDSFRFRDISCQAKQLARLSDRA